MGGVSKKRRDPREDQSIRIARGPYQGMTALCGKMRGKLAQVQFDNMDMPGYEPWITVPRRDVHFRRPKTNWSKPWRSPKSSVSGRLS